MKQAWYMWILDERIQNVILGIIILNAITLGMETSPAIMEKAGGLLHIFDTIALTIYCIEIGMKMLALRTKWMRDAWNVFDFIIVGIAFLPNAGALAVLRSLRILRALRLISTIPKLRLIVQALLQSIPSIGWISLLLFIIFYIFAVMATRLFGPAFPEWFGSLGETFYTLFQVLTLESWSMGIARPVMDQFPYAYIFFVPFILLTTFVVLNVFIAIIVNAMDDMKAEEKSSQQQRDIQDPTKALQAELALLRTQLEKVEMLAARCSIEEK